MIIYIEDILVTCRMDEEHLVSLEEVNHRIESAGLRLKRKCSCMERLVGLSGLSD